MASGVAPWVLNAVGGVPVGHTLTLEKVADERVLGRGGFALTRSAFQNGGDRGGCGRSPFGVDVAAPRGPGNCSRGRGCR